MTNEERTILTAEELHQHFPKVIRSAAMANIMARQGKIPSLMIGRRRFFCLESIQNHFMELERKSVEHATSGRNDCMPCSNIRSFGLLKR